MDSREKDLLSEWTKQVFDYLQNLSDEIKEQRRSLDQFRDQTNHKLAELDKIIAVYVAKIAGIGIVVGLIADYAIRILLK